MNGTRPASAAVFILTLILVASAMSLVCVRRPSEQQSEGAMAETPVSDAKQGTVQVGPLIPTTSTKTMTGELGEILSDDRQPPVPTLSGSLTVVYPEEVRKAGIHGTVKLHIYVNDKGRVTKVKVVESVHPALDSAAIDAARKSVFLPPLDRGQQIGWWILLPVTFSLLDSLPQDP